MTHSVLQALGEMSILYPVSGGFYTLAIRFLDPAFAFSMGWNYVFQWAIVLPLELTVAVTTVQYWGEDLMPIAGWITVFWIIIGEYHHLCRHACAHLLYLVIASIFGTLGFAEEEFWSSMLKLLVVIVFVLIGM